MSNSLGSVQDRPGPAPTAPGRSEPNIAQLVGWSTGIVGAVAGVVLVLAAFAGRHVRPIAEDWCTMDQIRDFGGIPNLVRSFYEDANGRVANALANGVVFLHGSLGPRLLPALLVLTLVAGTFSLMALGAPVLGWRVSWWSCLAAAATVTAALFFGGQVVYQVFFWASGSISHTLPSVVGVWTVVLVLGAERVGRRWSRITGVVVCGLAGVFIGSLSEAFFAVSGIYAAAAAGWGIGVLRRSGNRYPLAYPASYLAGLVVGFLTLYFSPGRAARQSTPIDQATLLSPAGVEDLLRSWFHTVAAVAHGPAYLAPLAVGVLVGLGMAPATRLAGVGRASIELAPPGRPAGPGAPGLVRRRRRAAHRLRPERVDLRTHLDQLPLSVPAHPVLLRRAPGTLPGQPPSPSDRDGRRDRHRRLVAIVGLASVLPQPRPR